MVCTSTGFSGAFFSPGLSSTLLGTGIDSVKPVARAMRTRVVPARGGREGEILMAASTLFVSSMVGCAFDEDDLTSRAVH
jgi:hypothetical protein